MDSSDLEQLVHTLPVLLGLAAVAVVAFDVVRTRSDFFRALRGWIVAAFVVALAVFWAGELARDISGGLLEQTQTAADLAFVAFTTWLAVCMATLGTTHRELNHLAEFRAWVKAHPVNHVSAWGAVGLLISGTAFAANPSRDETLSDLSWLLALFGAYLVLSILIVVALQRRLALARKKMAPGPKPVLGMALLAVVWMGIPTTELLVGVIAGSQFDLEPYSPDRWIMLLLFVVLARYITRAGSTAMVIDPESEAVRREGFREYDIPRGAYLIHDERSDAAFALFSELISLPLRPDAAIPGTEETASATLEYLIPRGLVVTREYPDKVRSKHRLQVTPMIWLTESPGERRIAPTSLALLTDTLIRFMETNPNSIVLLEGIEYISTFNDAKKVLRFLDALNETAWVTKARLILTVNPHAFDIKDLALLERDRTVVRGAKGVEELKVESRIQTASPVGK